MRGAVLGGAAARGRRSIGSGAGRGAAQAGPGLYGVGGPARSLARQNTLSASVIRNAGTEAAPQ